MPAQGYLQPCKPSKQSLGGVEVFMLVLCRDNQAIPGNPLIANVSQGRGGNPPMPETDNNLLSDYPP